MACWPDMTYISKVTLVQFMTRHNETSQALTQPEASEPNLSKAISQNEYEIGPLLPNLSIVRKRKENDEINEKKEEKNCFLSKKAYVKYTP